MNFHFLLQLLESLRLPVTAVPISDIPCTRPGTPHVPEPRTPWVSPKHSVLGTLGRSRTPPDLRTPPACPQIPEHLNTWTRVWAGVYTLYCLDRQTPVLERPYCTRPAGHQGGPFSSNVRAYSKIRGVRYTIIGKSRVYSMSPHQMYPTAHRQAYTPGARSNHSHTHYVTRHRRGCTGYA